MYWIHLLSMFREEIHRNPDQLEHRTSNLFKSKIALVEKKG